MIAGFGRMVVLASVAMLSATARPVDQGPVTSHARGPGLNHTYVVLDQATFDALRDSALVADLLGRNDAGLPDHAPAPANADRFFLRGRQTYLELFAPKNRFAEPVGKVGIGIGADSASQFRRIETGWHRSCGPGLLRENVQWRKARPPVPWYDSLSCSRTSAGNRIALWAMLYRPEFHRWQTGAASRDARVDRSSVLASRRATGQGRFDITGLTMDVTSDLFVRIAPQLDSAGLRRVALPGGARWTGDDWSLTLRRHRDRTGLRSIRFVARGMPAVPRFHPVRIGNAWLARSGSDGFELKMNRYRNGVDPRPAL